jgi:hypothetical protein
MTASDLAATAQTGQLESRTMRRGERWKSCPFGQRHHVLPVCVASMVLGESAPFFSAFQRGTMLGRALASELVLGPRRQLGHDESLSMLRGERWNEWPFSQRHHAGRKLRTRTDTAAPFFDSSQSLLSRG